MSVHGHDHLEPRQCWLWAACYGCRRKADADDSSRSCSSRWRARTPSPRWWRQNLERKSFARPLPAARAADAAVPKPASLAFFIRSTPGYRFPSSPCPDLTHRFALVRRSAFCERPTSSDSLIRPRASRRMYLASPRGENRSRFAAPFRFAVFRLAALAGRGTLLVFVCRTGSDTTGGTSAPY
jgi:hypothetical protein